jgi:hypothetical protein
MGDPRGVTPSHPCSGWARPEDWLRQSGGVRLGRVCWTLGCLVGWSHVALAFHFAHDWSHAAAMEHSRQVGGLAEGIFVNHLFMLAWTADAAGWWLWPGWYASRSAWIDRVLHGFLLFVVVNATVVFAAGPVRWAGVALLLCLAAVALSRRWARTGVAG